MAWEFSDEFGPEFGSPPNGASRGRFHAVAYAAAYEFAARRLAIVTLDAGTDGASEAPYRSTSSPIRAARLADVFLRVFPEASEDGEDQELSAWLEYASPGEEIDPTLGHDHPPDAGATWTQITGSILTLDTSAEDSPKRLDVSPNDLLSDRRWIRLVFEVTSYSGSTASSPVYAELWGSVDQDIDGDSLIEKSVADVIYSETDIEVPEDSRNDLS